MLYIVSQFKAMKILSVIDMENTRLKIAGAEPQYDLALNASCLSLILKGFAACFHSILSMGVEMVF